MNVIPIKLLDILSVSMVFSVILMALIQKLKAVKIISKKHHIWLFNIFFSFFLGIPFGMLFYDLSVIESVWVGIFGFIGASSIYDKLKNYTPISLSELSAGSILTKNDNKK